jgi:hypothetical protein
MKLFLVTPPSLVAVFLFLLSQHCHYHGVHGMMHLTPAMREARTVEELMEAEQHNHPNGGVGDESSQNIRKRMLQEEGLVDSATILADHFENVPGFYHGVASGTF